MQIADKVSAKKDKTVEEQQDSGEPVHGHVSKVLHVPAHQDEVVRGTLELQILIKDLF